jgi:large subunit ribosomal protein L14
MITLESIIHVADNSGARTVKCIKICSSGTKRFGYVGQLILATLKKKFNKQKVKKKTIYYGILISTKYQTLRKDGSVIKFSLNRALLFSKNYKFLGTRIYGSIMKEVKFQIFNDKKEKQRYLKTISYCKSVI